MSRELANQCNLASKNIGVEYPCGECVAARRFFDIPEYISTFSGKYI